MWDSRDMRTFPSLR